ncbi:Ferredoxin [Mycena indigotica]|uniref:Ferredoxin n=1 Tax=Mycena indigotica TaxID=2126181 RepID=A0A8H6T5C7_9AGAR|nr:Ferredoxin [Mycena indigotica]KAF7312380.1 Ferredoxin [Mycena indigotica]
MPTILVNCTTPTHPKSCTLQKLPQDAIPARVVSLTPKSFAAWRYNASGSRDWSGLSRIKIHFKDSKGELVKTVEANEGDDLLSIAHEYDIELEGACEGSVACSTCHVILPPEYYDLLPEPEDDENDMLDMAFGLTDTSRLGCQVKLTRELDGMTATLPAATRNMFVDGGLPTNTVSSSD